MKITCLSDLHGFYPNLEGGDLLIMAGDYTASDKIVQWGHFFSWLKKQNYRKKILIAGNHDNFMMNGWLKSHREAEELKEVQEMLTEEEAEGIEDFEYLCDSGIEFEGLKIWGSPWTTTFPGMNPHCKAFTRQKDKSLESKWKLIPDDVDILVTHSPPWSIRDLTVDGRQVGSPSLMAHHITRLRPKLWVYGHIHEGYGQESKHQWTPTIHVNASHVNERYQPVNPPINIIL